MAASSASDTWGAARRLLASGRLSVVMPAYRLAGRIAANVADVEAVFPPDIPHEIVVVDDGSRDGSVEELARLASSRPDLPLKTVALPSNGGKGNALKAGFRSSCGSFVLLLDGDLDLKPGRIPEFFDSMERAGSDIVIGSKRHPGSDVDYPWHRRLASVVYYSMVRLLTGLPATDTQVGMKLFRREVLGAALDRMLVKDYAFDVELLAIACGRGAKISEAPVTLSYGAVFGALSPRTVRNVVKDTFAVFYRLRMLGYYAKVEVPPPMAVSPLVSIVIACPKGGKMLGQCLEAISRQSYPHVETIVLPDEDAPQARGRKNVRVIPTGRVRPAEKRNLGIAEAKGSVIAFIDDDAYPDERWLENAVKYFSIPAVGAVGGPGVTPPDDPYLARLGGRVYSSRLVSGNYRYRYVGGMTRRDIDDYPSCNLLVRTELLRSFGGYRIDFWPGEDTLLCRSITEAGKRIVYDPWAIVYHHRRPLFAPHLRQLGRYAFHRGYFCKRFASNSLHFSYFVPSFFVVYLLAAAVVQPLAVPVAFKVAALAPLAAYCALVLVSSFSLNPVSWALVFAGIASTHILYGINFVRGLLARRAPCEFIGKDHD